VSGKKKKEREGMGLRGEKAGPRGERRQVGLPGLSCFLQFPFLFLF
jgi:hypothetical protein